MPQDFIPPVAFYFSVEVVGGSNGDDARFQEVSGIEMELELEEIAEGGLNSHKHRLPSRTRYSNLVLKRGYLHTSSSLADWCKQALQSNSAYGSNMTKNIKVSLLDERGSVLTMWEFTRALPVKWSISNFNAQENALVLETLEFSYQTFTVN
ncbi:MAG: phage tail protein [Bacteroidia bacterium]|nr:phage tail protein [Bacteroidia bacterium]